jgi:hypothetical protein
MPTVYTPPVSTYVPLATVSASGGEVAFTFSSIPSAYKHLVFVVGGKTTSATALEAKINGSTANLSTVYMYGAGSGGGASGGTSVGIIGNIGPEGGTTLTHFFDYSATDKHKTFLMVGGRPGGIAIVYANRWASLDAINSISFTLQAGQLVAGTVLSLYGIAG